MAATPAAGNRLTADLLNGAIHDVLADNAQHTTVMVGETTASLTYTNLATVGPQVTLTSRGTRAVVLWALVQHGTAGSAVSSPAVSGATTLAAADTHGLIVNDSTRTSVGWSFLTITPGTNTFTLRYRTTAGTATFLDRKMLVWAP